MRFDILLLCLLGLVAFSSACGGDDGGDGGDGGDTDPDAAASDEAPEPSNDEESEPKDIKKDHGEPRKNDGGSGDTTTAAPEDTTEAPMDDKPSADECAAFTCTGSACGYADSGNSDKKWEQLSGKFKNRVTGIKSNPDNSENYHAVYLKKGEKADFESASNFLTATRNFRIDYWEAVEGHALEVCCDDSCPFSSDEGVYADQQQWQTGQFKCQEGTSKVTVKCVANGDHQGACGVGNIDLVDDDGNSLCGEAAPAKAGAAKPKSGSKEKSEAAPDDAYPAYEPDDYPPYEPLTGDYPPYEPYDYPRHKQ